MTIIFEKGDLFWIEVIHITQSSVAATSTRVEDVTLDRAGVLLGYSASLNTSSTTSNALGDLGIQLTEGGGQTQLLFGADIIDVRCRMVNNSAGGVNIGASIILLMRGNRG